MIHSFANIYGKMLKFLLSFDINLVYPCWIKCIINNKSNLTGSKLWNSSVFMCVCGHVYVVYEDTNLYNGMGMT